MVKAKDFFYGATPRDPLYPASSTISIYFHPHNPSISLVSAATASLVAFTSTSHKNSVIRSHRMTTLSRWCLCLMFILNPPVHVFTYVESTEVPFNIFTRSISPALIFKFHDHSTEWITQLVFYTCSYPVCEYLLA